VRRLKQDTVLFKFYFISAGTIGEAHWASSYFGTAPFFHDFSTAVLGRALSDSRLRFIKPHEILFCSSLNALPSTAVEKWKYWWKKKTVSK